MQKCWICNHNNANSEEHKIKASEIRRLMGNKNFDGFYKTNDNEPITINNSKHKSLKFPKIICDDCNNRKTAQADSSYKDFVVYIENHYDDLLSKKNIDFKEIYGKEWHTQKINIYRYFAKHAGCKTFFDNGENNFDLSELAYFILGNDIIRNFYVFFELNTIIGFFSQMTEYTKVENINPLLGNGATVLFKINGINIYAGVIIHSFLRINWIITEKLLDIKQTNFNDNYEDLELIDWDFYPTRFSSMKTNMESIEYLIFGKLNSSNTKELKEHYREIIYRKYNQNL